ncbi:MAG: hypothetical protein GY727_06310, partial [Gammaproteobacteria bacterium]|nr:hypothetical protein [Gammaproteobacteria bacterium]
KSSNTTTGTTARAAVYATADNNNSGTAMQTFSTGYTSSGLNLANFGQLATDTLLGGLAIGTLGPGDPVIFGTGNTERMRLDGSGNVGIGTTSPARLLNIAGAMRLDTLGSAPASPASGDIYSDGSSLYYHNGSSWNDLTGGGSDSDWTISGSDMYSAVTGNVGIGTPTPGAMLEILGPDSTSNILKLSRTGYSDSEAMMYISGTPSDNSGARFHIESEDDIDFKVGGTSRMLIENSGNVGIGTITPGDKLEIEGGVGIAAGNYLRLYNPADTNAVYIKNSGSVNLDRLEFGAGTSGVMVLDDTGNVGIGTTNPGKELHVLDGDTQTAVIIGNSGTGYSELVLDAANGDAVGDDYMVVRQNDDLSAEIFTANSAGNLTLRAGSTSTNQLVLNTSGNVGIGTLSPARLLNVAGAMRLDTLVSTPTSPASGDIYSDGN